MKVLIRARPGRSEIDTFSKQLLAVLAAEDVAVTSTREDDVDVVLAVGGDGTMLSAVSDGLALDAPVLGFNLGTIGFLTSAEPENVRQVVRRLTAGDYRIESRMTVEAEVAGFSVTGVNDVVIEKVDSQRLVELAVQIQAVDFVTYRADGLIIATPTGSTAYSFSAGGPLVSPRLDAFVLTPVAAHSLFSRSMVLPPDQEIVVKVKRDRSVKVSVDKTSLGELGEGQTVTVRRGSRSVGFITLEPKSFPGLVREKFDLP